MAGNLSHFEIRAEDAERAHGFWSSLFGWEFNASPGEIPYLMTDTGNGVTAGLYRSEAAERGLVVYFNVDDLEASLDRVRSLGGIVNDKGPVPEIGWYAHCTDTEGNRFGLFQQDASAA
jgi:predicted enzyme related to lactoylglutathione lyase